MLYIFINVFAFLKYCPTQCYLREYHAIMVITIMTKSKRAKNDCSLEVYNSETSRDFFLPT